MSCYQDTFPDHCYVKASTLLKTKKNVLLVVVVVVSSSALKRWLVDVYSRTIWLRLALVFTLCVWTSFTVKWWSFANTTCRVMSFWHRPFLWQHPSTTEHDANDAAPASFTLLHYKIATPMNKWLSMVCALSDCAVVCVAHGAWPVIIRCRRDASFERLPSQRHHAYMCHFRISKSIRPFRK